MLVPEPVIVLELILVPGASTTTYNKLCLSCMSGTCPTLDNRIVASATNFLKTIKKHMPLQ